MSNVSLSISVSEELKEIIMQRTRSGYFGTPSEYLRHLVREDISRNAGIRKMEDFIQQGIDSGASSTLRGQDLEAGIERGLVDSAAGRTMSSDEYFESIKTNLVKKYG